MSGSHQRVCFQRPSHRIDISFTSCCPRTPLLPVFLFKLRPYCTSLDILVVIVHYCLSAWCPLIWELPPLKSPDCPGLIVSRTLLVSVYFKTRTRTPFHLLKTVVQECTSFRACSSSAFYSIRLFQFLFSLILKHLKLQILHYVTCVIIPLFE